MARATHIGGLLTALAILVSPAQAAPDTNQRLLFDNPDFEVTARSGFFCNEPVPITVRSTIPRLFEAQSARLQGIVDATRAVLGFECPVLQGIRVQGRLTGLDEPVYSGMADPDSDWMLVTRQSIESEAYDNYNAPSDSRDTADMGRTGDSFTVAGLSAGMSVDEARAAVAEAFGTEADFDIEAGALTMRDGGCPGEYDWASLSPPPQPGWKCLDAWFTDQRMARLYLLDLIQVIEASEPDRIMQQLIERFGEPVSRATQEQEGGWWDSGPVVERLAWGEVVETRDPGDAQGSDIHALQAKIVPLEDATVVAVTLYRPALRPGDGSRRASQVPDLTL